MNIHMPHPIDARVALGEQNYAQIHIHFVLQSQHSTFAMQACLELLSHANRFARRDVYVVQTHRSFDSVFERSKKHTRKTVILFGNIDEIWHLDTEAQKLLRVHLPCLSRIGLVGGAALIASKLHFLRKRAVSIHPNMSKVAVEEDICVRAGKAPVYRDGSLYSAIGGLAAPAMIAAMISEDLGAFIAEQVMDYVGLQASGTEARTEQENQYFQLAQGDPFLTQAISLMADNIETRIPSSALANALNISSRQLERVFRTRFNESPMQVYRNLRLEHADQLLRYSDMPIFEISLATGFGSVSQLSQRYRARFDRKPSETRAMRYGR